MFYKLDTDTRTLTSVEEESEGKWVTRGQTALFEGAGSLSAEMRL